jgi:hypothetical protein
VSDPVVEVFRATPDAERAGLDADCAKGALAYVYDTLGAIDEALLGRGSPRLAQIVELANLSSMIGNLLRTGVAQASKGVFRSNGPHKHPDLLHRDDTTRNVEIKVALEDNQPKGHLAKPGWHLTCHYVLCDDKGAFTLGTDKRGTVPRVWMLRFGFLREEHFNISNTEGDSGKTAVVNAAGMAELKPIYFDSSRCSLSMTSRSKKARAIFESMGLAYVPRE